MKTIEQLYHKLIVSCQALEDEPLHSSYIMSKMALAAKDGGAAGIRANSISDIQEIKQEVDLPIIGIIKSDYEESEVRITPTIKEVNELVDEGVDIIAIDATNRLRPGGLNLVEFLKMIRKRYPKQIFMADISNFEEAKIAVEHGIDIIGTTLVGYTAYTIGFEPLDVLAQVLTLDHAIVIAEGNINTPEMARKAIEMGAHSVVVGSAITRPQLITQKFVKNINNGGI